MDSELQNKELMQLADEVGKEEFARLINNAGFNLAKTLMATVTCPPNYICVQDYLRKQCQGRLGDAPTKFKFDELADKKERELMQALIKFSGVYEFSLIAHQSYSAVLQGMLNEMITSIADSMSYGDFVKFAGEVSNSKEKSSEQTWAIIENALRENEIENLNNKISAIKDDFVLSTIQERFFEKARLMGEERFSVIVNDGATKEDAGVALKAFTRLTTAYAQHVKGQNPTPSRSRAHKVSRRVPRTRASSRGGRGRR